MVQASSGKAILVTGATGKQGGAFDLAGDVRSMEDAAETFANAIGRLVTYVRIYWADFESWMSRELTIMYRFFERAPVIDPAALRAAVPGASTLETHLRKAGWGPVKSSFHFRGTA